MAIIYVVTSWQDQDAYIMYCLYKLCYISVIHICQLLSAVLEVNQKGLDIASGLQTDFKFLVTLLQ